MAHRIRYIAFSVVIAVALVWAGAVARGPLLEHYAAHLAKSLPSASEEQVETTLDRIASLGNEGFPMLLEALESPREVVAHAATERVLAQAARWERMSPQAADAPLGDLVARLAARADRYPPSIRTAARGLALRVLQRPMLHAGRPRIEIFAACDRLLETPAIPSAGHAEQGVEGEPVSGRPSSDDDEQVAEHPKVRQAADWRHGVIQNVASLPGGGLQCEPAPGMPSPETSNTPTRLDSPDPKRLPADPQAAPLERAENPYRESTEQSVSSARDTHTTEEGGDTRLGSSRPKTETSDPDSYELPKPRIYEVMRTFATGPTDAAKQAETQLADCGFRPLHFRLAKRLFHEDPEIRQTLARVLPDIPGVRAETWLLYLCHDREPSVRETALGMLLTLDNPAVIREAKRITDAAR